MKSFVSAGDVLINPELLAFASVETDSEGVQLRLGFAGEGGAEPSELRLTGPEARSVLGWLRANAEFLDAGAPSFRRQRFPEPGDPAPAQAQRLGARRGRYVTEKV